MAGFSPEDLFGGLDLGDIFGDAGFDLGLGGIFDRFFHRAHRGPAKGADLKMNLAVTLKKIASGGPEPVSFGRLATCPECQGSGARKGTKPRTCSACGGSGKQIRTQRQQKDKNQITVQQISACPSCHGQGHIVDEPCPACKGRGKIERTESLTVMIPKGVEEGTALRIPGYGMASPDPNGQAGDLFVIIHSQPDPDFERNGADLWHSETIGIPEATLGTVLEIPTLGGHVSVTVPAGTQPDSILRLRGKGLPDPGGGAVGDLLVRIQVQVPVHLSPEEKKLYQQLRALGGKH